MNKHKIMAAVIVGGAGYELYQDFIDSGTTVDYAIDGAMFLVGVMLLFHKA